MIKSNITKALLLSILVSGSLAIHPVNSQRNSLSYHNAAIEEVNKILEESNKLRDIYSILYARLGLLAVVLESQLSYFDENYEFLYEYIHATVSLL